MSALARWWREALAATLLAMLASVVALLVAPHRPPTATAVGFLVACIAVGGGVISHVWMPTRSPWIAGWSFLAVSGVCATAAASFLIQSLGTDIPVSIRIPMVMFLLVGVFAGASAHIIDAGTPRTR